MSKSPCLSGSAHERAEAIVGRCGGGREGKDGWMVPCPAHDDRSPSLSIKADGDKVLLHCFAGCEKTAIVAAIAIDMRDLFVDDAPLPRRSPRPAKPPKRKMPPEGMADPVALAFAVDLVIDDVEMLTVDGLVTVLKQAASDPVQWLWLERAFAQAGMTPAVVWQALFPTTPYPYLPAPSTRPPRNHAAPVMMQGRPLSTVRLGNEPA